MSAKKTIIGGSLSNPHFRKALRHYRILDEVMSVRNKYDEIAKRLNIV